MLHYFLHYYSFFDTGINFQTKITKNLILIMTFLKIEYFEQFFSMLNFFAMMVYDHSVYFIILMFPVNE